MNKPQRIVSLLPSATEIICALGLEEQLVGVSHECEHRLALAGKQGLDLLNTRQLDRGSAAAVRDSWIGLRQRSAA